MNAWVQFQKARLRINSATNRWRRCHFYGLAVLLLFTGCSKVAPAREQEFYEVRERNAHPAIQRHLEQLREQLKSQGLTFKIGYTTALDRRIADLVGTKPPADLPAKIQTQNEAATKLLEIDVATSKEFADQMGRRFVLPEYLIKLKCSATSKSFHWRKAGSVTGVRQQQCGNCWAYASMAALEASYLIRNTWTIDGSEQYIVNCAVDKDGNDAGTCSGGWHAGLFDYRSVTASRPKSAWQTPAPTVPATLVYWPHTELWFGIMFRHSHRPQDSKAVCRQSTR